VDAALPLRQFFFILGVRIWACHASEFSDTRYKTDGATPVRPG
jgi:hypothetical protein